MTDVESVLRERLHAELDSLEPSTLIAREALRSGHRARRRRTAVLSAAAAVVLIGGGVLTASVLGRPTPARDSVVATGGLADRTVTYAEQFRDGDFASIRNDMTPEVRPLLPESRLRSVWQQAIAALGPLVRIPPAVKDNGPATYLSALHFRSGDAHLRVTYDDAGRVIGITLLTASVEKLDVVPSALADTSRQVVDALAHGRYDEVRKRFDTTMTRLLTVDQLRDGWQQAAVREHGGFVSTGGMTATKVRGATVVDVFCTMKRGELRVRISYDDAGLISGLLLQTP